MNHETIRRMHEGLAHAYVLLLTELGASPLEAQRGVDAFCAEALALYAWGRDGLSESAKARRIELHVEEILDEAINRMWDKRDAATKAAHDGLARGL